MADIDYKQLARELLEQQTATKAAGTAPTFLHGHGNGGLFSNPALESPLISAMVLPITGLQSILPVVPTTVELPLYGVLTGVTDSTGSEPTGPCDDPPYAGLAKLCMQAYPLGRFSRRSRTMELDQFGKIANRGENPALELWGDPFGGKNPNVPTLSADANSAVLSDIKKALFEFAVAWARDFARVLYTGNPANNTWQGGYKEFNGLDILINTGYRDAVTSTVCPAADSLIASFGDVQVQLDNGASLVNHITQIIYELVDRANRMGLSPATWVLAMRPQLFHIVTSYWSCSYLTYRCANVDGANIESVGSFDMGDAIAMRDAMRQGSYLLVDGVKVPVVQDDAIAEIDIGAGVYESSIYFVPTTVLGGRTVTYMEYFDYSTPQGFLAAAQAFAPAGSYTVSDGGRFAWHLKPPSNWCVEFVAKTEPRLILRTPQLAARLTDIRYVPYVHERDWDPDGTYFVNGGGISQGKTTYYSPV